MYCHTSVNLADVVRRSHDVKKSESRELWCNGAEFLRESDQIPVVESSAVSVKRVTYVQDKNDLGFPHKNGIDLMNEAAPSMCRRSEKLIFCV